MLGVHVAEDERKVRRGGGEADGPACMHADRQACREPPAIRGRRKKAGTPQRGCSVGGRPCRRARRRLKGQRARVGDVGAMPCLPRPPAQTLSVYPPGSVSATGGLQPGAEPWALTVRRKGGSSECARGPAAGACRAGGRLPPAVPQFGAGAVRLPAVRGAMGCACRGCPGARGVVPAILRRHAASMPGAHRLPCRQPS